MKVSDNKLVYLPENVYEKSIERIDYIYDNFDRVVVNFSGGKDSTLVLHLALEVAKKKGRLPVPVFFLDQEAEHDSTIEYVRRVMNRDDVMPLWYQVPFKTNNSCSTEDNWLYAWKPGEEWMRDKEPMAIKDCKEGDEERRFTEVLDCLVPEHFKGENIACLIGMRTQENFKRKIAIVDQKATWKYIGWCARRKGKYDFNVIYDWEYSDVWKYIHNNKVDYNKLYDWQFQYGMSIPDMRVSSLVHEIAVKDLYFLQEIEGETYNKLQQRVKGVNCVAQNSELKFFQKELPYMFHSWEEYRDYLNEHITKKEKDKEVFRKEFTSRDAMIMKGNKLLYDDYCKQCVKMILKNDTSKTTISNFKVLMVHKYLQWKKTGKRDELSKQNKYIQYELERGYKGVGGKQGE